MRSALFLALALALMLATASAQDNSTSGAVEFKKDLRFDMAIDAESFQFAFVNASSANASSSEEEAREPKAYQMVCVLHYLVHYLAIVHNHAHLPSPSPPFTPLQKALLYPAGFLNASNLGLGESGKIAANLTNYVLGVATFECALLDPSFQVGALARAALSSCASSWYFYPQNEATRVYVFGANYTYAGEPNSTVPALNIRSSQLVSRAMIAASVLPGGATMASAGVWASPLEGSFNLASSAAWVRAMTGGTGAYRGLTGESAVQSLDTGKVGKIDAVSVRLDGTNTASAAK